MKLLFVCCKVFAHHKVVVCSPIPSPPPIFFLRSKLWVGMQLSWQSIRTARCQRRFDSLVRQGIFLLQSTFSADSLAVSIHPHVQSHAFTTVCTLKILQSMSEFDGLGKHQYTQYALQVGQRNSVAAGFPQGRQPEFSMGEIPLGQYSCKNAMTTSTKTMQNLKK